MAENKSCTLTDGTIVQRTKIHGGGPMYHYSAWRPMSGCAFTNHSFSTITHIDGRLHGRVGTDRLPANLDALPAMTDERSKAVRQWHTRLYELTYDLILNSPFGQEICRNEAAAIHSMGAIDVYAEVE